MCMERELLNDRINNRVDVMVNMGLLHEVESVCPYRSCTALNTVGYKEIFDYMDGNLTLQQAIDNIKTNTRRYAKRQMTWFRRYNDINWIETDKCVSVCDQALQIIENTN